MNSRFTVIHMISPEGVYGAENVVINLSQELIRNNVNSIIGVIHQNQPNQIQIIQTAEKLGIKTVEFVQKHSFDLSIIYQFFQFLKKKKIHIIHSHGYKATIFCFISSVLKKIPMTVTCHLWYSGKNPKLKLYHLIEAFLMRFLPVNIAVSDDVLMDIKKHGVKENNIKIIYNGINLINYPHQSKIATNEFFNSFGITNKDFVIGTIGRLEEQKAQHYLIKAVATVKNKKPNIKCFIVGDGSLRNFLSKKVKELNLENNLFIVGYRNDCLNILDRFDLFILTSLKEGLPMVLIEAMATKTPIISTPAGQINNIIKHRHNGIIIEHKNIDQLPDAIIELSETPDYGKTISDNALAYFYDNLSSKKMSSRYIDVYKSILRL